METKSRWTKRPGTGLSEGWPGGHARNRHVLALAGAVLSLLGACDGGTSLLGDGDREGETVASDMLDDVGSDDATESGEADDAEGGETDGGAADSEDGGADQADAEAVCGDGVVEPPEECEGASVLECVTTCGSVGTRTCTACSWSEDCRPPMEIACNGLDDDCDGVADDGAWCPADLSGVSGTIEDLSAIHGSGCADVWVVGEYGEVLHWDGRVWSDVPSGTTNHLYDSWCLSQESAWIVGEGIWRWNGVAWEPTVPPAAGSFRSVWGWAEDAVWVGGASGGVYRWNGVDWSADAVPWSGGPTKELFGSDEDHVYALVDGGAGPGPWFWDGVSWTRVASSVIETLPDAVWGARDDDIWLGGRCATDGMARWNGAEWTRVVAPCSSDASGFITGIHGSAADDVWAVGGRGFAQHWDGLRWLEQSPATDEVLVDVYVCPTGEAWALGWNATIVHWTPAVP